MKLIYAVELLFKELSHYASTLSFCPNILFTFGFLFRKGTELKFRRIKTWILGPKSE
jgi:hypothetical protein